MVSGILTQWGTKGQMTSGDTHNLQPAKMSTVNNRMTVLKQPSSDTSFWGVLGWHGSVRGYRRHRDLTLDREFNKTIYWCSDLCTRLKCTLQICVQTLKHLNTSLSYNLTCLGQTCVGMCLTTKRVWGLNMDGKDPCIPIEIHCRYNWALSVGVFNV